MASGEHRKSERSNGEQGFILVVVLAMTLLLALVAAAVTHAVRSHIKSITAGALSARAEAMADAGLTMALLDLTAVRKDPARRRRFPLNGTVVGCAMENDDSGAAASVSVSIIDEAGKVNLNTSNEQLIAALFRGLSASEEEAESAVDHFLDFRDGDDTRRPKGAESSEYAAVQGLPSRAPKNASLVAVDELDQILGVPPALVAEIKRFSTVNSTLSGIDPEVASLELKMILREGAGSRPGASLDDFAGPALPPGFLTRSNQSAFTLRTAGRAGPDGRFVREAIIELTDGGPPEYIVRRWGQTGSQDDIGIPASIGASLPPC